MKIQLYCFVLLLAAHGEAFSVVKNDVHSRFTTALAAENMRVVAGVLPVGKVNEEKEAGDQAAGKSNFSPIQPHFDVVGSQGALLNAMRLGPYHGHQGGEYNDWSHGRSTWGVNRIL